MTRSLITGISGFVASHLADLLIDKGEEVFGTYRWNEDLSRIKHAKDKITLIPANLNDLSSMIKAVECRPDYIYHLAAESYVSDSFAFPHEAISVNTLGTLNLLEAVRMVREQNIHGANFQEAKKQLEKLGKTMWDPVIQICSSSEVYGLVEEKDIPIDEDCRFNPSNPYAVGKVGADMLGLLYFTNYGIKTIRTRMFTHTGPRRTMMSAECAFAKQIAEIEKGYKELPILKHGNLDSIRTWADVRDAVRAYYELVRKCKPGEVYNIGGNTTKSIEEMLDYLISLSSVPISKEEDPKLLRPYDVTLQIPDCSKFLKETGWKPEYSFETTMTDLLNYWRENV